MSDAQRDSRPSNLPFSGLRALVLGGSGGIGAVASRVVSGLGAHVVVHGGHDVDRAERVVAALRADGGSAEPLIRGVESVEDGVDVLVAAGEISILVLAYGPMRSGSLRDLPPEEWIHATMMNLALPGALVSRCLGPMLDRGFGRILLFGGTGTDAIRGYKTVAAYSAAKIGLGVLARSVARECAGRGVCCNLLVPGFVDTEYLSDDQRVAYRRIAQGLPLTRPEDLAPAIRSCLVAEYGLPNGAIIDISAGSFAG